jgi:hypothetical protein
MKNDHRFGFPRCHLFEVYSHVSAFGKCNRFLSGSESYTTVGVMPIDKGTSPVGKSHYGTVRYHRKTRQAQTARSS